MNKGRKTSVAAFAALCLLGLATVQASTIISGPTTSGIWTPEGSPYIISADNGVPDGQSLTIEPGTEVVIGPGVSLNVTGSIHAIGTFDEPITIRGVSSNSYWERIYVSYGPGDAQSEFGYCNISDCGGTALRLHVHAHFDGITMQTDIHNCSFNNISNIAIYASAMGGATIYSSQRQANQQPTIRNCSFSRSKHGGHFVVTGLNAGNGWTGYGYADPVFEGNIFSNLTGNAVTFNCGDYGRGGAPEVHNNIMMECAGGVVVDSDYYDAEVFNNIFVDCGVAVERVSTLSQDVLRNCFYNNATNFVNYPSGYGNIIWSNENGDPSDLFYNIFMDPLFEAGNFYLSETSPCIDAGDPSIDDYFYPAPGTSVSDMGAYGGAEPGAGVPPAPPVIVSQPQSQKAFLGQDVTFEVEAAGAGLSYQWYFGASALSGETNNTLELVAVDFTDAGNYYVTVSNQYDVITSTLANLRVTEIGLEIAMHAGLHMTNLVVGTDYSIQAVNSLTDTNWFEIDMFEATSDNDVWYDSGVAGQKRYYQVISQP